MDVIFYTEDDAYNTEMCLDAILDNLKGAYTLYILYSASNEKYENGYEIVLSKEKYKNFNKIKTEGKKSKEDLIDILNQTENSFVLLLTDKDILHSEISIETIKDCLNESKELVSFSLRLGKNVKINREYKSENILVPLSEKENYVILDWSKHYLDFSKPFSIHGHCYRTKDILKIIKSIPIDNFFDFEEGFSMFENFPKHEMACLNESALFTILPEPNKNTDNLIKILKNVKVLKEEKIIPYKELGFKETKEVFFDINFGKKLIKK